MGEIITAVMSGCITLLGVLLSNRAAQAVTDEKLAELTREVRELNDFARQTPVLEEHLRGVDRRLEKLERSSLSEHRVPSYGERSIALDISIFGIAGVAAITVICYLIGQGVKASGLDNKWIPVIVGACGGVLGVAGMFLMADFPAGDVLTAAAVGIVSGLAATGVNQAGKQLFCK